MLLLVTTRFVYDVEEDVAAQRKYVMQVAELTVKCECRCFQLCDAIGGALCAVLLQGAVGGFREGIGSG